MKNILLMGIITTLLLLPPGCSKIFEQEGKTEYLDQIFSSLEKLGSNQVQLIEINEKLAKRINSLEADIEFLEERVKSLEGD